jgi:hypothetical protein
VARIRTIKPEFPQSESMGNVSRDARLLFVMLWPVCDDHGRTRAASRMLASTLFPYDTDAPGLIDGWLDELEREGCITRYKVNGSTFLEICNWLTHQKIDKPSKPVFPLPPETVANAREDSSEEGIGKEGKGDGAPAEPPTRLGSRLPADWTLPDDWREWATAERPGIDVKAEGAKFADYWHAKPGKDGRKVDWQATWRNWIRNSRGPSPGQSREPAPLPRLQA